MSLTESGKKGGRRHREKEKHLQTRAPDNIIDIPVATATGVHQSVLYRKRTHLERISCLWLHGGSSNNSHVLGIFSHAAHSDLALQSSASNRGPCSSLQPPTEEEIGVYWCCANNTAQKYDCDYCVVPGLRKAVSQSLGKMFLNDSEICIWRPLACWSVAMVSFFFFFFCGRLSPLHLLLLGGSLQSIFRLMLACRCRYIWKSFQWSDVEKKIVCCVVVSLLHFCYPVINWMWYPTAIH